MKHPDKDLLNEIMDSEGLERFRQGSLACGLEALRRRRHRRALVSTCSMVGLPMLAALLLLWFREDPKHRHTSIVSAPLVPMAVDPGSDNDVKVINDEQLFALFPNRALALVGKPGHQQLVFLDQLDSEQNSLAR